MGEADAFFRDHLTPRAYREETDEGMNTVLCNGIYEYIACRSQNKIPPHRHPIQRNQRPPKTRGKHQRTVKALKEKQAKKQLRALRRDGTQPEQVWALAQ